MSYLLKVWLWLTATGVAGWTALLLTARINQIEGDLTAYISCGTCEVQRAQSVSTAAAWLQGSLLLAILSLTLSYNRFPSGWRYGYLAICAAGITALLVHFVAVT